MFTHAARLFALVALVLTVTGAARAGTPAEDRMSDIVRNVRANEELYKNREIFAHYKYTLGDAKHLLGGYVKSTEGDYRIVMQGGLSYAKAVLPLPTLNGGKGNANTLQGWDGLVTRAVEQDAYCNLIKGERHDDYRYYLLNPHTLPFWRGPSWLQFPLADYLAGGAAVRSKRAAGPLNVRTVYLGEETVDDLACMKVRCLVWAEGFKEPTVEGGDYHDVWLAPERNYIPILVKLYVERMADVPIEVRAAGDFREVEPGIWYPYRFDVTVYDDARFVEDKKVNVSGRETYTIKSVDLHPHHDISLFRDIEFPENLPLYTIENGQIIEHRKAVVPDEPVAGMGLASRFHASIMRMKVVPDEPVAGMGREAKDPIRGDDDAVVPDEPVAGMGPAGWIALIVTTGLVVLTGVLFWVGKTRGRMHNQHPPSDPGNVLGLGGS